MTNRILDFLGLGGKRRLMKRDLGTLAEALLSGRGEASGVALAQEILSAYAERPDEQKVAFLRTLADRFGSDPAKLERAIAHYHASPGPKTAATLHAATEPRRQELFRRLNLAPGGTHGLVRMREDCLKNLAAYPALESVDADFVQLFSSWFNRGFLEVRRIDWSTQAHILEKIIRYEAVHEITGWTDLRRRLEPGDRSCFAFFHPALVDEPLIFIEVALTSSIPDAIGPLIASGGRPAAPKRPTTAVFYSISSCQPGLRGVSLGNFLIKQVVEELEREVPSLKTFVTLSPVPGFARWLRREREARVPSFLSANGKAALQVMDRPDWLDHTQSVRAVRPVQLGAIAQYLLVAKDGSGRPLDAVARFHLGNGARLERVNWMGDVSKKGLAESAGFMANYLYDHARIERNHELFANRGQVVASASVRKLLRDGQRWRAAGA